MFKKYYFLPFLDNLKAIGISLLAFLIFGSWMINPVFSTIATIFMLVALCGFVYSRMWKLSRRNTQRKLGLTAKDFVKFMLPLIVFEIVIITFYCLCEEGIIPLDNLITKTYYNFPDDAAREIVNVSLFDYVGPIIKIWFSYLVGVTSKGYVLFIAPIVTFGAAMLGYRLGCDNKLIQDSYINITEKAKKKFNE